MRILFNHSLSSLCHIADLLRAGDPSIWIGACHARDDTPIQFHVDNLLEELSAAAGGAMPPAYPEWLLETARRERVDVVVPYRHRLSLSEHVDRFSAFGIRLLVAGRPQDLTLIEDKPSFLEIARTLGIPASPFTLFSDRSSLETAHAEMSKRYPAAGLCVKPATGIYGSGFRRLVDDTRPDVFARLMGDDPFVISTTTLRAAFDTKTSTEPWMLMPFLPGVERSVDIACLDGAMLGAVCRLKAPTHQVLHDNAEARTMAARLVENFRLSGLINIQTLEDASGRQHLLEMNTRASGGIGMTSASGVNLPDLLRRGLEGEVFAECRVPAGRVRVAREDLFRKLPDAIPVEAPAHSDTQFPKEGQLATAG